LETHLIDILRSLLGLIPGGTIGLGFGRIQAAAQRRHEKLHDGGGLKTGWAVVRVVSPGAPQLNRHALS
jgi:hypothetical protein